MRRRNFIQGVAASAAWPLGARAQQPTMPVIGFLNSGTREGFAVLRDPIACKPAVLAETDDWVAFGTEFRAIATLPGVVNARIWEPEPATVYVWSRE